MIGTVQQVAERRHDLPPNEWASAGQGKQRRHRRLTMRLALRLLIPRGAAELASTLWLVVAAAALLSCIFLLLGLFAAFNHRATVSAIREPVRVSHPAGNNSTSLASESEVNVGGAQLIRLLVSPRDMTVAVPSWMSRWPEPGEFLASAGALRLIKSNPYAAALTPGRMVGTIGPAGLRDPDEAYTVVGLTKQEVQATGLASPVSAFGAASSPYQDVTSGGLAKLALIALGILIGGSVVLFHTVTRLSSRARRRRLAVLQLLGAPTSMVRSTTAISTAALASIGALAAIVAHPLLARVSAVLGVAGVHWWSGTAVVNLPVRVALSLAIVLAIAISSRRTVDADPWARRRGREDSSTSAWRVTPLVLGLSATAGVLISQHRSIPARAGMPTSGVAILAVGLLAILIGAPLAAPSLTRVCAQALAGTPWLSARLGAARASHHALSTARVASALMVLILITGLAIGDWDIAAARYRADHGVMDVTVTAQASTTWAQALASQTLTRSDLVAAGVDRPAPPPGPNGQVKPGGGYQTLSNSSQIRPDDLDYDFVLPAAAARGLAAEIERTHPGTQQNMFNEGLDGPHAVLLGNAAAFLALFLSAVLVLICLAITLLTLQGDRAVPDAALLMSGLSRTRLRLARAAEVLITSLPPSLLSLAIASQLARAAAHLDDPTIPVPGTPITALTGAVVIICLVLALAAAAATPNLDPNVVRRD